MESTIIQTLRSTLSDRGLSLAQVATDAGISKEGLRLILLGKRSPSLDTLCAVAGVLGMKIECKPTCLTVGKIEKNEY